MFYLSQIRQNLFHPLLFPLVFTSGYVLYILQLARSVKAPEIYTSIYIISAMLAYVLGVFFGLHAGRKPMPEDVTAAVTGRASARHLLWAMYAFSTGLFVIEHLAFIKTYGTIPILHPDMEVLRLNFAINGYIHMIAMMSFIFLLCLIVQHCYYRESSSRLQKYMLIIATLFSISLEAIVGNRGMILNFAAFTWIAVSFRKKNSFLKMLVLGVAAFYLFGLVKLLREYIAYGPALSDTIASDWAFGGNRFLAPLYFAYLGIAMNFNMLNTYIQAIDGEHFYGYFTFAAPFYTLLPGKQYLLVDLQRDLLNIDFHGALTATMLGVPFIDFSGFGALVILLIGFITGYMYKKVLQRKLLRHIIPYSYFYWNVLIGVYTYMFDKFHIITNIVLLVIISRLIERTAPVAERALPESGEDKAVT